jgi:hypothetical protein
MWGSWSLKCFSRTVDEPIGFNQDKTASSGSLKALQPRVGGLDSSVWPRPISSLCVVLVLCACIPTTSQRGNRWDTSRFSCRPCCRENVVRGPTGAWVRNAYSPTHQPVYRWPSCPSLFVGPALTSTNSLYAGPPWTSWGRCGRVVLT